MSKEKTTVPIDLEEAKEVYLLLEELNRFLHQPMNFEDREAVEAWASAVYPRISEAYYETVWNWLPEPVQQEIIGK